MRANPRRGFVADEQDFLALRRLDGTLGVHIQLAGGRTGPAEDRGRYHFAGLYGFAVKDGASTWSSWSAGTRGWRSSNQSLFLLHLDGEADGSQAGAFAVAGSGA